MAFHCGYCDVSGLSFGVSGTWYALQVRKVERCVSLSKLEGKKYNDFSYELSLLFIWYENWGWWNESDFFLTIGIFHVWVKMLSTKCCHHWSFLPSWFRLQARGLDVLPTTITRFRKGDDNETADLLEKVVYPEEITHCAAGVKWFKYLCLRSTGPALCGGCLLSKQVGPENEEVIKKFHAVVRTHFRGPLKPPFNEEARKAAGFGPQWYEPLSVKETNLQWSRAFVLLFIYSFHLQWPFSLRSSKTCLLVNKFYFIEYVLISFIIILP